MSQGSSTCELQSILPSAVDLHLHVDKECETRGKPETRLAVPSSLSVTGIPAAAGADSALVTPGLRDRECDQWSGDVVERAPADAEAQHMEGRRGCGVR